MTLRITADLICASVSRQRAAEGDEPKDHRLGRPVLSPTNSNTQSGAAQTLHLSTLGCEENNTKWVFFFPSLNAERMLLF